MNTDQRKTLKESRAHEQATQADIAIDRLKEIMDIANKLNWIFESNTSYPTMELSEVEKCMLAMINDQELERLRGWAHDK